MPRVTVVYKPLVISIPGCQFAVVEDNEVEDVVKDYVACIPAVIDHVEVESQEEDRLYAER